MKFKKDIKVVSSTFWGDLFDSPWCNTCDILAESKDIERVEEAMSVLRDFRYQTLQKNTFDRADEMAKLGISMDLT